MTCIYTILIDLCFHLGLIDKCHPGHPVHSCIHQLSSANKVRFRNQISTLPQPNFDDSATKIRYASATKKGASATKKKDSATKKGRFRNQNKTIPQPKTDDSATKIRAIRKPKSASLCNQDLWFYTLHGIVSKCHTQHGIVFRCSGCSCGPSSTYVLSHSTWHRLQMRWGGVGWDKLSFLWHTWGHAQHGIVFRCGGVGWGGVGQ